MEAELRDFIEHLTTQVLVIVDEAYHEYATPLGVPDASKWMNDYPNLMVIRTFSKVFGLAGIRVGHALSSTAIAEVLNRVRQPFNVNTLALLAAEAALGDGEFVQ